MGKDVFRPLRREVGADNGHDEDDDGKQQEYLYRVVNKEFERVGKAGPLPHPQDGIDDGLSELSEHPAPHI
jgi:hypothetical protein